MINSYLVYESNVNQNAIIFHFIHMKEEFSIDLIIDLCSLCLIISENHRRIQYLSGKTNC